MASTDHAAQLTEVEKTAASQDSKAVDIALRRYDVVFRYFAAEHAMSWTKNQFFLAANGGLLALGSGRFPKDAELSSLVVPAITSILGLAFSMIWLTTLRRAGVHVDRWKRLCKELEPLAFGEYEVLRNAPDTGMRRITRLIAKLFVAVWSCALVGSVTVFFVYHH